MGGGISRPHVDVVGPTVAVVVRRGCQPRCRRGVLAADQDLLYWDRQVRYGYVWRPLVGRHRGADAVRGGGVEAGSARCRGVYVWAWCADTEVAVAFAGVDIPGSQPGPAAACGAAATTAPAATAPSNRARKVFDARFPGCPFLVSTACLPLLRCAGRATHPVRGERREPYSEFQWNSKLTPQQTVWYLPLRLWLPYQTGMPFERAVRRRLSSQLNSTADINLRCCLETQDPSVMIEGRPARY